MAERIKISELAPQSVDGVSAEGVFPVSMPDVETYKVPIRDITDSISLAQTVAKSAVANAALALDTANAAIPLSQRGVADGVASLDVDGKVPTTQLPSIGGEVDPPDLVSGDATNALGIGQDGKLFVPTVDAGGAGSVLEEVEFAADFHYTDVKWRRIMTFTVPPDDTEESYNNLHGKLLITLKNSGTWPGGNMGRLRNGVFEFRHSSSVYAGRQRWQGIPALSGFNLPVPCRVVVTDNTMHVDIMSQISDGQYGSGTFNVKLIAADFGGYTWTQGYPEFVIPNAEMAYELKTLGLTESNSGIQSNKFFDSSGNDVARQFPVPDYSAFRVDSMPSAVQPGTIITYDFSEDCYFWFGADQEAGGSLNLHMNGGWIFDHLNNNTHYLKIQTGIFFAVQGDTLVLNNQTAMLYNPQIRKFGVKFISR